MALLLGPLRRVRTQGDDDGRADDADAVSYRAILRRPAIIWLTLLTFIAMFIGYGQMEAGFPAFAARSQGSPPSSSASRSRSTPR